MPNKTILLFVLASISLLAYADDDGVAEGASTGTSSAPVQAANSQTFTVKGSAEEDKSDCKARLQEYLDQQVCMGPYHNKNGGIRAEAFAHCGPDVKYPIDCPMQ